VFHKIIVYETEYEEAERRTNSVEIAVSIPIFFSFLFLSLSLSLQKRWMVPRKIRPQFGIFQFHFFSLNTKYDKAADIRLASTL